MLATSVAITAILADGKGWGMFLGEQRDRQADLIIGVPTWCEAANISAHTRRIDEALRNHDLHCKTLIVNADNRSPDGTANLFMATPTHHAKLTLTANRGKGNNEAALFDFALRCGAEAMITLDGDLEALPGEWLPALATPVMNGSADLVTPLYSRFWYDGTLTNQVVAPMVLAVTGAPIRQPIGGEFAFSRTALRELSARPWPEAARGFGWDVYVVVTALHLRLKMCEASLPFGKVHSWRSESADEIEQEMSSKFTEIASTTLEELATFALDDLPPIREYRAAPPLGREPKAYDLAPGGEFTTRWWTQHRNSTWLSFLVPRGGTRDTELPPRMDNASWARVLCQSAFVVRRGLHDRDFFNVLEALFFLRLMHVLPEYRMSSTSEIDMAVYRLAILLRREIESEHKAQPRRVERPRSSRTMNRIERRLGPGIS